MSIAHYSNNSLNNLSTPNAALSNTIHSFETAFNSAWVANDIKMKRTDIDIRLPDDWLIENSTGYGILNLDKDIMAFGKQIDRADEIAKKVQLWSYKMVAANAVLLAGNSISETDMQVIDDLQDFSDLERFLGSRTFSVGSPTKLGMIYVHNFTARKPSGAEFLITVRDPLDGTYKSYNVSDWIDKFFGALEGFGSSYVDHIIRESGRAWLIRGSRGGAANPLVIVYPWSRWRAIDLSGNEKKAQTFQVAMHELAHAWYNKNIMGTGGSENSFYDKLQNHQYHITGRYQSICAFRYFRSSELQNIKQQLRECKFSYGLQQRLGNTNHSHFYE